MARLAIGFYVFRNVHTIMMTAVQRTAIDLSGGDQMAVCKQHEGRLASLMHRHCMTCSMRQLMLDGFTDNN